MKSSRPGKDSRNPWLPYLLCGVTLAGALGATLWLSQSPPKAIPTSDDAPSKPAAATNPAPESLQANLEKWVQAETNALPLMNQGTQFLAEGQPEAAVLCYRRAVELKPEDEEGHFNLGLAYARANRLTEAEQSYRKALELFSDYAEAHMNLGNVLVSQKRLPEAVTEYQQALKLSPEDAAAHNNLGRALAEQGETMNALKCFQEATRLDANYLEGHFNLGIAFLSLRRTNEAVLSFEHCLSLKPGFVPAARMLERLGK